MKRILTTWMLMIMALLVGGCAVGRAAQHIAPEPGGILIEKEAPLGSESLDYQGAPVELEILGGEGAVRRGREALAIEPLVIRTANLTLVVKDPAATAREISDLAEEMGGFVVFSNIYQTSYNGGTTTQASLNIRVPSERLDEALERIRGMSGEPPRRDEVRGEDVTQQYVDLKSRLRNLEAAEEQLLEIMEAATDTEDVLRVFEQLQSIREQIEVLKGQIQYFEDAARLASIQIELIPDELAQPLQIGRWQPQGTAKEALEALIRTLQLLANLAIWLVIYVAPVLLVIFGPMALVIRTVVRRTRRRKAAQKASMGES